MGETTITIHKDYVLSCVMYSAFIANPSTGKSTGLGLMKAAVYEIEEFNGIDEADSSLVNGE